MKRWKVSKYLPRNINKGKTPKQMSLMKLLFICYLIIVVPHQISHWWGATSLHACASRILVYSRYKMSLNCFEIKLITALRVSAPLYLRSLHYFLQKPPWIWPKSDKLNWPGHGAALPRPCGVHTSSSFFKPTPLLIRREAKTTNIHQGRMQKRSHILEKLRKLKLFTECKEFKIWTHQDSVLLLLNRRWLAVEENKETKIYHMVNKNNILLTRCSLSDCN